MYIFAVGETRIRSIQAEVVKLVDTLDLGSSAARRGGSSPLLGTIYERRVSMAKIIDPVVAIKIDPL